MRGFLRPGAVPLFRRVAIATLSAVVMSAGVLGTGAQAVGAPTPSADYEFQHTLSSSVAGAPNLTRTGSGINRFVSDSVDGTRQTVLSYPVDNGVQLYPTSGVVSNDVYTIAVLVRMDDVTGMQPGAADDGWVRLVDFKHGTADSGLYDYAGQLNLYPDALGAESPAPLVDGVYEMVVLTRDITGLVTGYVNGVQQFSFDDSVSQDAVIDSHDTLRFFRDNTSGNAPNEASSGAVARVELFNSALSASEVAALTPSGAPTISITPRSGGPGTAIGVSGGGFSPGETVRVTYKTGLAAPNPASAKICTATVSAVGTYSCSGAIPSTDAGATGNHHMQAKGSSSGLTAITVFTLT